VAFAGARAGGAAGAAGRGEAGGVGALGVRAGRAAAGDAGGGGAVRGAADSDAAGVSAVVVGGGSGGGRSGGGGVAAAVEGVRSVEEVGAGVAPDVALEFERPTKKARRATAMAAAPAPAKSSALFLRTVSWKIVPPTGSLVCEVSDHGDGGTAGTACADWSVGPKDAGGNSALDWRIVAWTIPVTRSATLRARAGAYGARAAASSPTSR